MYKIEIGIKLGWINKKNYFSSCFQFLFSAIKKKIVAGKAGFVEKLNMLLFFFFRNCSLWWWMAILVAT